MSTFLSCAYRSCFNDFFFFSWRFSDFVISTDLLENMPCSSYCFPPRLGASLLLRPANLLSSRQKTASRKSRQGECPMNVSKPTRSNILDQGLVVMTAGPGLIYDPPRACLLAALLGLVIRYMVVANANIGSAIASSNLVRAGRGSFISGRCGHISIDSLEGEISFQGLRWYSWRGRYWGGQTWFR